MQNIGNPYQMEDDKNPKGGGAKRRPLGAAPKAAPCCLPFGKDFLCFGLTSGAHSGSIFIEIARFSELFHGSSEKVKKPPPNNLNNLMIPARGPQTMFLCNLCCAIVELLAAGLGTLAA